MSTGSLASLYGDVYAPLYFSAVLTAAFYGVSCMQTFYYFVHYPNDLRRIKIFVGVMWGLDTIHVALIVSGVCRYIMAGLLGPLSMVDLEPELVVSTISAASIALPTQAFFIHRIYHLSGKGLIAPLLWVFSAIFQLASAIVYEAKSFYIEDGFVRFFWGLATAHVGIPFTYRSIHLMGFAVVTDHFFMTLTIASLSLIAAVDGLIAIALTTLVLRKRATAGFASTTHILQRLTMFAVNTGLWTAVFAVLSAILMHVFPTSALYAVFSVPLTSVYCNTLLANLNARTYIRGEGITYNSSADKTTIDRPKAGNTTVDSKKRGTNLGTAMTLDIRVTTESSTCMDLVPEHGEPIVL